MFYTLDDLKLIAGREPDTLVVSTKGDTTLVGNDGVDGFEIYTPQEFMEWRLKKNHNRLDKLAKEVYSSTVGLTITKSMCLLDDLTSDDYDLYTLIHDNYDAAKVADYLSYEGIEVAY